MLGSRLWKPRKIQPRIWIMQWIPIRLRMIARPAGIGFCGGGKGQSGKKTIAAIAGVVCLVIAFSVIYNLLPPRNAAAKPMTDNLVNPQKTNRGERQVDAYIASIQDDQFQQIAKGLIVEMDGDEDAVEPFILSEENNQTQFAVYNDTEYFFYGQMVVYDSNQKTLGTLEIPLTKPYSYAFVDGVIVGEASDYEYKTAEFYSLSYLCDNRWV